MYQHWLEYVSHIIIKLSTCCHACRTVSQRFTQRFQSPEKVFKWEITFKAYKKFGNWETCLKFGKSLKFSLRLRIFSAWSMQKACTVVYFYFPVSFDEYISSGYTFVYLFMCLCLSISCLYLVLTIMCIFFCG